MAAALVVLSALFWWTQLRPTSLGGPLTIVTVTGVSMEPGLRTGDLAVVHAQPTYDIGDVVAFRTEGRDSGHHVIHRLVGGSASDGFVTRGDNNGYDDPWTPRGDELAGRMVTSFPGLGTQLAPVLDPVKVSALLAALTVFMVVVVPSPAPPTKPRHRAATAASRTRSLV